MMERIAEASPRFEARTAGVCYLLNILTILIAVFFFRGFVVSGDAAATAANVLAREPLFRSGIAFEMISTAFSIAVAALFYALFKPVNGTLSLLAAFFRLIACAIAVVGYLFQLAPLVVLGRADYLNAFKLDQLQALALLSFKLHSQVVNVSIVFFGFHFLLTGFLIFKSSFLPRILGVFCTLAGLGGLTFLAPTLGSYLFRYLIVVGLLAEVSLTLWLLVKGVNEDRWKEQASRLNAPAREQR